MGIYAALMEQSDACGRLALEYRAKGESDLALRFTKKETIWLLTSSKRRLNAV